ncbi:Neurofilament heavy polypeptide (NF-H) (200 kDa neurofilament protein) (Neurofilament triplet H protein) [Durusdinium trenchii]|uniref:Neurofilament heavy polypeptide (NF-H) (200 kDa neurofilament protein) (Neurofilament triplet H protein) n=1 Tax=Durusdinium trenchii TaxID=1381693 RepID=A0ABP0K5W8_9DINO
MLNRLCTDQVQSPVKREVQVVEQVQSPLKPEVQVVEQVQSPVKREVQVVEQVQSPLKPEVQVVEQVQSPLKRDVQVVEQVQSPLKPEMQVAEQAPLMPEVRAVQEQAAKPGSTAEEGRGGQLLADGGGHLLKWLREPLHQQSQELNHFRPELPNGRQVNEVQNDGANDQSFLRQWLQKRQAPSSYTGPPLQSRVAERTPVDLEVTRLPETDVTWLAPSRELTRGEVYRAEEASIRLAVPSGGEQFRSTQAVPSFPAQEFRPSSYMPLSAQGDSRLGPTGAVLGSIRSKSFGGVERRQTMAAKPEPRHGDLSPGRGPGDSLRLMAPLTPGGHGLVAPLAEHLQHQGFGGGTPVSKPDPLTMANALTTINSLPQGGWQQSSQHGSHQLQADAFQRPHALSQRQALGGLPNPATDFFSPLNNNLFGASALGSTRPFSLGGPCGADSSALKPAPALIPSLDEEMRRFEPPPPPRSAPSLQFSEEPLRELLREPPREILREPPRRHPEWEELRPGFGVTQNMGTLPRELSGLKPQGLRCELKVRTSESHWESLRFSAGDDLDWKAQEFVQRCGLKHAFLPGVVARLKQMVSIQQEYACVDIVDLI